ncbi:MAG: glutathione-dependent formaldehyde dehydrogenase, partial [Sphingomonas bacterium]|nr:glutathione-dependent formaldehyde dehydrogenase [Sphingomonas bacterium]
GMESHGMAIDNLIDTAKAHVFLGTDRPMALRQMIIACRKGGRLSIPGVYGGMADKFPIGALMEKGLSVKSGQTHVQKFGKDLLDMIGEGKVDTTFLISHHASLEDGPEMYGHWHDEQNDYTKIVLKPELAKGDIKTSIKEMDHVTA